MGLAEVCEAGDVDFRDDDDWTALPDVQQAIRDAGAEQTCFCLAIAPDKSCWGVGIGNGWKGRQPAAKLSLALALAMNQQKLQQIAPRYPEFQAMCAAAGLVTMEPDAKRQRSF